MAPDWITVNGRTAWYGADGSVYMIVRQGQEVGAIYKGPEDPDATATPALSFELRPHQLTPEQNAVKKNYLNTGNEDPEVRAIYLYKEGSSSLYRLRLE